MVGIGGLTFGLALTLLDSKQQTILGGASLAGFFWLLVLSPLFSLTAFCIHFLYLDRLRALEFLIAGINLTWFAALFTLSARLNMVTIFSYATPILWGLAAISLTQIVTQKKHRHHTLAWAIAVHPVAAFSMAKLIFPPIG